MNLMTSMMMSLLVGIASIALVVGGIGIMNMMLCHRHGAHDGNRPAQGAWR